MFTLEDKSKLISDFEEIYKFRKIIEKNSIRNVKRNAEKRI